MPQVNYDAVKPQENNIKIILLKGNFWFFNSAQK